jgi:coniferyl-aldehyde dehydrogenase
LPQRCSYVDTRVTEVGLVVHLQILIGGQFRDSVSGKTSPVVDPRNEEVVLHVAEAGKEDVDLAVKAAREAFDSGPWPKLTGKVRAT